LRTPKASRRSVLKGLIAGAVLAPCLSWAARKPAGRVLLGTVPFESLGDMTLHRMLIVDKAGKHLAEWNLEGFDAIPIGDRGEVPLADVSAIGSGMAWNARLTWTDKEGRKALTTSCGGSDLDDVRLSTAHIQTGDTISIPTLKVTWPQA